MVDLDNWPTPKQEHSASLTSTYQIARPLTLEKLPLEIRLLIYREVHDEPVFVRYGPDLGYHRFVLARRVDIKPPLGPKLLVTLPKVSRRLRDDIKLLTEEQRGLEVALKWGRVIFDGPDQAKRFASVNPRCAEMIKVAIITPGVHDYSRYSPWHHRAYEQTRDFVYRQRETIKTAFPAVSRLEVVVGYLPTRLYLKNLQLVLDNLRRIYTNNYRTDLEYDHTVIKLHFYRTYGKTILPIPQPELDAYRAKVRERVLSGAPNNDIIPPQWSLDRVYLSHQGDDSGIEPSRIFDSELVSSYKAPSPEFYWCSTEASPEPAQGETRTKRKRGRPRKTSPSAQGANTKRKRGRPRKLASSASRASSSDGSYDPSLPAQGGTNTGRKRGRPRKASPSVQGDASTECKRGRPRRTSPPAQEDATPKRKRGRPRKTSPPAQGDANPKPKKRRLHNPNSQQNEDLPCIPEISSPQSAYTQSVP